METYVDCITCFAGQAIEAVRVATDDVQQQQELVKQIMAAVAQFDFSQPPPTMARDMHRMVRQKTGYSDPYLAAKRRSNALALRLRPSFRRKALAAEDPFGAALSLAIAANVIDLGIKIHHEVDLDSIGDVLEEALRAPLPHDAVNALRRSAQEAEDILYLADNAGEIVFDRLLIEQLPPGRVTVVVRGGPIINDALMEDARQAGIDEVAGLMSSGSDAPGVLLDDCSDEFLRRFEEADMVIAKGQGNYETLSAAPRGIFFLLRIKCPVVAADTGLPLGGPAIIPPARRPAIPY
ncbi:MAG: DUF89 family protein [Planctomycetes bacterium]|nr:DUF89 family protein [Planctomycetota bacterium]